MRFRHRSRPIRGTEVDCRWRFCLAAMRRQTSDIFAIVNTNAHSDHLGSNLALKRLSGAPITAHEQDALALTREHQWGGSPFLVGPADRLLRGGDATELGDRRSETAHLRSAFLRHRSRLRLVSIS